MKHDISLLKAIEQFEECKLPFLNYTNKTDFEDIQLLKHYLRRMAHECDWVQKVITNALVRLENGELQDKFKEILDNLEANKHESN